MRFFTPKGLWRLCLIGKSFLNLSLHGSAKAGKKENFRTPEFLPDQEEPDIEEDQDGMSGLPKNRTSRTCPIRVPKD